MTEVAGTDPYPWPWDGDLTPSRLALVVCGAQEALAAAAAGAAPTLAVVQATACALRERGALVVWVRHGATPGRRPTWLPDPAQPGWGLVVTPEPADLVVDAAGWDGSFGSRLDHELRRLGRDHLVLAGLACEITVDSTVRTLNDRGYECLVATDACAPLDAELGAHAFGSLTMSGGIFGALGTTAALLAALGPTVPHPYQPPETAP